MTSVSLALLTWFRMRRRIRSVKAAKELRIAKDDAEAANRAKSQFLAAASHDLRQPTHALSLFIAALRSMAKRPQVKGEDVGVVAARLQLALDGLGRLLNGLLDVSRLEAGAVEVNRAPVSLQERLSELHNAFAGPAQAKGIELRVARTTLWADTDPVILARVLSNLVANAVRYTERGRILIGCRRRTDEIDIQVLDTGIGIAEDQRAKIFEEFYQVGNVARDREHGLGLGLAIVQRSVKLLGGNIRVDSISGKGSRFSLTLPRAAMTTTGSFAKPIGASTTARNILIIDDNPEVLESMQQLLTEWGHKVTAVRTIADAVAAASPNLDLILADYRLADNVNGADAIRAVIAAIGRTVPAVIITGDTSPARIREAQASGYTLLHKPLDTRLLQELVNRAGSEQVKHK